MNNGFAAEQQRLIPARDPGEILGRAIREHQPSRSYALLSGGKDSSVTVDYLLRNHRDKIDGVLHLDTGIGIPSTQDFVRQFCADRDVPLVIERTPEDYEEIVMREGFPGRSAHRYMYVWLKERALDSFIRKTKRGWRDRIMLITGVRAEESERRMGTCKDVERDGAQLWVAPLIDWSNMDMHRYREQYNVPMSEASRLIHISGECLCGSFASDDEMAMLEMFYPEVAERIHAIEAKVAATGNPRCVWGKHIPGDEATSKTGRMCRKCDGQMGLLGIEDVA